MSTLRVEVCRSKRPLEELEESWSDVKRPRCAETCSSSVSPLPPPSPSNGLAASPVCSPAISGDCDYSNLDDTLLEPSNGEKLDSPTGLSPEDEDKLLSSDEDFPGSVISGQPAQEVEHVCLVASLRVGQLPSGLEKTLSSEPLPLAGPPASPSGGACGKYSESQESGNCLNMSSQVPAGLELGCSSPTVAEMAPAVSGVTGQEAAQAVEETLQAVRQRVATCDLSNMLAEGLSSSKQQERGRASTAGLLHETEGPSGSVRSQEAALPNSANGSREAQEEVPCTGEPKRPTRICIQESDLEQSKEKYIYAVLNHARCAAPGPVSGEVNELHELMRKVAAQSREPGFEHPTDLTVRNFAQRSNCTVQRFSLQQWVERNSYNVRRFAAIPDRFERSTALG
ncbi:S100P-binding protein isoform X2 [Varanus komodoensis]|uniref:S100P-binding protein isoform X2 n=1 Tax=Varanus komodoensis TaxID=61221 RepID=UPI001CF7B9C3|nr:S100P-binding protein isoform X2 [Varanus komodoensis]